MPDFLLGNCNEKKKIIIINNNKSMDKNFEKVSPLDFVVNNSIGYIESEMRGGSFLFTIRSGIVDRENAASNYYSPTFQNGGGDVLCGGWLSW